MLHWTAFKYKTFPLKERLFMVDLLVQPMTSAVWEAEVGRWHVQDQTGLQSKFKAGLGNLEWHVSR